jgi:hypothetical protein
MLKKTSSTAVLVEISVLAPHELLVTASNKLECLIDGCPVQKSVAAAQATRQSVHTRQHEIMSCP